MTNPEKPLVPGAIETCLRDFDEGYSMAEASTELPGFNPADFDYRLNELKDAMGNTSRAGYPHAAREKFVFFT